MASECKTPQNSVLYCIIILFCSKAFSSASQKYLKRNQFERQNLPQWYEEFYLRDPLNSGSIYGVEQTWVYPGVIYWQRLPFRLHILQFPIIIEYSTMNPVSHCSLGEYVLVCMVRILGESNPSQPIVSIRNELFFQAIAAESKSLLIRE